MIHHAEFPIYLIPVQHLLWYARNLFTCNRRASKAILAVLSRFGVTERLGMDEVRGAIHKC